MSVLFNSELLGELFTPCTMRDVVTDNGSDGLFGKDEHYKDGAKFLAMLEKQSSPEVVIAERQGLNEFYKVVVPTGVNLKKGDVFRRDSDGLTFMATSNTRDGAAPPMSTVQIAVATCKRWDEP